MISGISGKTKVCGVIGDPIEHTMSPAMHNAAFKKLDMDYVYLAFRVLPPDVGYAMAGMKALNIRGMNVTIPHKIAVMSFLTEIDPLAEKIGAVNTVVNEEGVLTGYNTDASGFLQSLLEVKVDPAGKKAVVLGAGGASRAISFALAERGAQVSVLNREQEFDWAQELARRLTESFGREVKARLLTEDNVAAELNDASILVNATSVGMSPNDNDTPVAARHFRRGLVVFDAVYNPLQTRFLKEAKAAGARTISGIEMLVWQGALAFQKWTGKLAPVDVMRQEAIRALQK